MAPASRVEFTVYAPKVPVLAAAKEYAAMGLVPAGSFANRNYCHKRLQLAAGLDPVLVDIFSDAQTNGGRLPAHAATPAAETVSLRSLHVSLGFLEAQARSFLSGWAYRPGHPGFRQHQ